MSLLEDMKWDSMTDEGMWVWSAILTLVVLVASYFVAVAWQRWKEKQRNVER